MELYITAKMLRDLKKNWIKLEYSKSFKSKKLGSGMNPQFSKAEKEFF
jgi:hypothetical protein